MDNPRFIHMDRELFNLLVKSNPEGMHLELIDGILYDMNSPDSDPRFIHMSPDLFDLLVEYTPEDMHLELIDGVVYNMAPPSDDHERMKHNMFEILDRQLPDDGPCRVMMEQYARKKEVAATRPDIVLTCHLADWHKNYRPETHRRVTLPRLIVEILSPSTEDFDGGEKFDRLKNCETLEVYIMVNFRTPAIEVYRRANDWQLELFTSGRTIHLEELGLKIDVDAVYRRVQL